MHFEGHAAFVVYNDFHLWFETSFEECPIQIFALLHGVHHEIFPILHQVRLQTERVPLHHYFSGELEAAAEL